MCVFQAIGATDTTAAAITDGVSGATVAYHAEDSDDDADDFLSSPARASGSVSVEDLFAQYERDHPELLALEDEHANGNASTPPGKPTTDDDDNKVSDSAQRQADEAQDEARRAAAVAATTPEVVQAQVADQVELQRAELVETFVARGVGLREAHVQATREVARRQEAEVLEVLKSQYASAGAAPEEAELQAVQALAQQQQQQVVQVLAAQLLAASATGWPGSRNGSPLRHGNLDAVGTDHAQNAARVDRRDGVQTLTAEEAEVAAVRAIAAQQEIAIQADQQEQLAAELRAAGVPADVAQQGAVAEVRQQMDQQRQVERRMIAKLQDQGMAPTQATIRALEEIIAQQTVMQQAVRAAQLQAQGMPVAQAGAQAAHDVARQQAQQRQTALASAFRAQGLSSDVAFERAVEEVAAVQQRQYVAAAALPRAQENAAATASAGTYERAREVHRSRNGGHGQSEAEEKQVVAANPSQEFLARFDRLHGVTPVTMRHAAGTSHIYPQASPERRRTVVFAVCLYVASLALCVDSRWNFGCRTKISLQTQKFCLTLEMALLETRFGYRL